MSKLAYFFQGNTLLLPADFPDSRIDFDVPLELAKDFKTSEIFEVPAVDESKTPIRVVSVLPDTAQQAAALPENWKGIPVRQVLVTLSAKDANPARLLRACHIAQWRRESRFCGSCGGENFDIPETTERRCSRCGREEFPRICPAVIVVVTKEDKILLAHNKKFSSGLYSLIAGFNEAGESLEATVEREIFEEVNIKVGGISYIKSQAWPFSKSLMIGFKACFLSGDLRPDGVEIEDAGWFTRDNLPAVSEPGSLSRAIIDQWIKSEI